MPTRSRLALDLDLIRWNRPAGSCLLLWPTLAALWIAERIQSRRTLVLLPSLSLLSQTLIEWGRNCRVPLDYIVACSDESVIERKEDHAFHTVSELAVPVTTDPIELREFLAAEAPGVFPLTRMATGCRRARRAPG